MKQNYVKVVSSVLVLLMFFGQTYAQNMTKIEGNVVEESGAPLIGVNITIKDKLIGTVTDAQGHFGRRHGGQKRASRRAGLYLNSADGWKYSDSNISSQYLPN